MMKRLVLGCCFALVLSDGACWGMNRSKSAPVLPATDGMVEGSRAGRPSSVPVTVKEVQHAIEITSMEQFNAITEKQAKKLRCVTFRGMEINEQFVDKFEELFYDDLDTLKFHNCVLASGMNYHTLFAGMYTLLHLEIKSGDLTDDDAVETFCCIYPWLLKSVVFSGDNLNRENVSEKLRQCSALSPDGVLSF